MPKSRFDPPINRWSKLSGHFKIQPQFLTWELIPTLDPGLDPNLGTRTGTRPWRLIRLPTLRHYLDTRTWTRSINPRSNLDTRIGSPTSEHSMRNSSIELWPNSTSSLRFDFQIGTPILNQETTSPTFQIRIFKTFLKSNILKKPCFVGGRGWGLGWGKKMKFSNFKIFFKIKLSNFKFFFFFPRLGKWDKGGQGKGGIRETKIFKMWSNFLK